MTRILHIVLVGAFFLAWVPLVQAASLSELAITLPATGQAAGTTAAAAPHPAAPTPPPAAAQAPTEAMSDMSAESPLERKKTFDNSRTNIDLFNKTASDPKRVKSLLYTPEEIKDLHLALNTYLKYAGRGGELTFDEEAFLSRLGGLKSSTGRGQAKFFTYPQFFLDSLVYYSAKDWLVWINGEKITQDTSKESSNIHVVQISADKVTVEWFPLEMNRVLDTWRQFPNSEVMVDAGHGQVVFTLKPNQTFSSYTMTVLEGRVLPVTVDITQEIDLSDDKSKGLDMVIPGEAGASETEKSKEGLGGLINSYQNIKKEE